MPWLEERTLILFVRDTKVRRYEPGVREGGIDVERSSRRLMMSSTNSNTHRALSLESSVIHCGHLVR